MLNALIIAALAAGPASSSPYADCVLANIQPGLSDRAVLLVQHACAAKYPASYADAIELERRHSSQRQAQFDADHAAAARSANAAAAAAQAAADRSAAQTKGADPK
ncbi:hypothetical protein C1929_16240 [Stenotrophomonas sp. ZAC14D1_NAIMI4_6]|uniref:hypothetical protein n=1 Tax=unclassified Stenotrophomonas maltophilia group TaxID=2961925 RepID=UPI000D5407E9|nr:MULTISPECIES: hypothetical protein [unclassified Stenotrophomonas maltophilia group]AWH38199.1 hypothetical protein C1929_16240 [Stenotrophomonas sp. ZAC14D1_NAIMI4_6]AWH42330.1 hypothetical protein C1927_16245 [Stenotrophomonas sp. ZAC14D1_NAIMI4_1]